jgi:hypothetical protein
MNSIEYKSNKEIIEHVEKIMGPIWNFNLDEIYGDFGSCRYPDIEELDMLYFKFKSDGRKYKVPLKQEKEKLIIKINELEFNNIESIEFITCPSIGLF